MRIWDLAPGYLDRQRLLGEHRELHGLANILLLGKQGYAHHPETRRWVGHVPALAMRHALLVAEMRLRGYRHQSPMPECDGDASFWPAHHIDPPAAQLALLGQKMAGEESMRIPLPANAQQLWAQHKYSVMAHDPGLYREIGPQVAQGRYAADMEGLCVLLVETLRTTPEPGWIANALQHMWGYLEWHGESAPADASAMLMRIQQQALAAGCGYLIASTALSELAVWLG